jgi:hypothetical protein
MQCQQRKVTDVLESWYVDEMKEFNQISKVLLERNRK